MAFLYYVGADRSLIIEFAFQEASWYSLYLQNSVSLCPRFEYRSVVSIPP